MDVALYRPQIPPNTGNIARLCVATGAAPHIVGPPAFSLDDRAVRRAGLDFWGDLDLRTHESRGDFRRELSARPAPGPPRVLLVTKHAERRYTDHAFEHGDVLVFGQETSGLPAEVHDEVRAESPDRLLAIPMSEPSRSLNLSNAVAVVLYEAVRQLRFAPPAAEART